MSALCPSYVKVMSLREHVQFQERICFNYRWCIESSCYVKQQVIWFVLLWSDLHKKLEGTAHFELVFLVFGSCAVIFGR